jgi:uncharacterized membrane protein (UPF0136 family)
MLTDKIILALYGVLLLAGGFFGWRAGSKISLIMGVTFGILVLIGVGVLGGNLRVGYSLEMALSGLLAVSFLMRFLKTQQFMPSGLMLTCSVIIFVYCLYRLIRV